MRGKGRRRESVEDVDMSDEQHYTVPSNFFLYVGPQTCEGPKKPSEVE